MIKAAMPWLLCRHRSDRLARPVRRVPVEELKIYVAKAQTVNIHAKLQLQQPHHVPEEKKRIN
jgi:hypothetical protein